MCFLDGLSLHDQFVSNISVMHKQEAVDLEQPSVDVPEPGTALENTADNTIKYVPATASSQKDYYIYIYRYISIQLTEKTFDA